MAPISACGVCLSFGYPIYRASEPTDVAGNVAAFEKIKEDWVVGVFWYGLVLGSPICIGEALEFGGV